MTIADSISWSDLWLVGFKKLDDDHQGFVNIIQRMQEAPLHELAGLLDQFESIARSHFDLENRMMEDTQFPPKQCHIDEHDAVLKSVKTPNEKDLEKQIKVVYSDDEWVVLRPLTYHSSLKYGSSTKWCTASESNPDYFLRYVKRGILLYNYTWKDFRSIGITIYWNRKWNINTR